MDEFTAAELPGSSDPAHGSWPPTPASCAMRTAVRSWLAPLRLDGSIEDALILATNEAPCNAVDHAHPPAGGDNGVGGTVDLALHTERGRACVEITDHGSWLEPAV